MEQVLVFFGVATFAGVFIRSSVWLRRRAAAGRRPEVTDDQLCELTHASRISSFAVIASLIGLALVGLLYLAL